MKNIGTAFVLYVILAYFAAWWPFKEEWTGFVYPDLNDLTISRNIGVYESFESCSDAAIAVLRGINAGDKGDYECGLNCEYKPDIGLNVCKETKN